MLYLTYEEYVGMGYSAVAEGSFPRYERIARGDIDYFTFGRITESTEQVKLAVCEILELYVGEEGHAVLSGVSVGKYSESYATPEALSRDTRVRDICLKYLPQKITTWVVEP